MALLTLASTAMLFGGAFKLYPDAKLLSKSPARYSTQADFARVAYFYRAIGAEQKLPPGNGDGSARAEFTFDSGETVVISRGTYTGDAQADTTYIEVRKTDSKPEVKTEAKADTKAEAKAKTKKLP